MQGWFHGHGIYYTIGGMKFEGKFNIGKTSQERKKLLFQMPFQLLKGEFRGGRIWGNGLMTYNDGKVGSEGYFQDSRFSRDGCAKTDVKKARKVAAFARR